MTVSTLTREGLQGYRTRAHLKTECDELVLHVTICRATPGSNREGSPLDAETRLRLASIEAERAKGREIKPQERLVQWSDLERELARQLLESLSARGDRKR